MGECAAREAIQAMAEEICRAVGLRKLPPIVISDAVPLPLVIGIWRPVIVIPAGLVKAGAVNRAAEDRLRDVLIHEAAHIAQARSLD